MTTGLKLVGFFLDRGYEVVVYRDRTAGYNHAAVSVVEARPKNSRDTRPVIRAVVSEFGTYDPQTDATIRRAGEIYCGLGNVSETAWEQFRQEAVAYGLFVAPFYS